MPSNWNSNTETLTAALNACNDPVPGASVSSGTGANRYAGQIGQRIYIGNDDPRLPSGIYGGGYQYVQFYLSATQAAAAGLVCYWGSATNLTDLQYVVTNDVTTAKSQVAGIALNAVTKGNYGWIQFVGLATVQYTATLTAATPAIGDLIVAGGTTAGTADDPTQSTALTYALARAVIGVAKSLPASNATGTVWLNFLRLSI